MYVLSTVSKLKMSYLTNMPAVMAPKRSPAPIVHSSDWGTGAPERKGIKKMASILVPAKVK